MNGIKFNEECIRKCIEAYHDMHNKYPYMICNEKTMEIIPEEKRTPSLTMNSSNIIYSSGFSDSDIEIKSISINSDKYVKEEPSNKSCKTWYGAKIIIDNDMKFGEVEIR